MESIFYAAVFILLGIGIYSNAQEIARSNTVANRKDRITDWLLKSGVKHSPEDDQRLFQFNFWVNRIGGVLAVLIGVYFAFAPLLRRGLPAMSKTEGGTFGWWLVFCAIGVGIWRWRSRKVYERILTLVVLTYGIFLICRHYSVGPF